MKQAIDGLKSIPGVIGACIFSAEGGLQQSNLPGIFKTDKLLAVGNQLGKLLIAGRISFSDINDLTLHYDESVVVARELRKGLIVFAICDPSFNHNLLTMSLNMLQEERDHQDRPLAATPAARVSGELDPLRNELKAVLAKVLGPMAGIILEEVHQEWAQRGATAERLPELIEMLNKEIGDPDKIATFESLAAPLLQA